MLIKNNHFKNLYDLPWSVELWLINPESFPADDWLEILEASPADRLLDSPADRLLESPELLGRLEQDLSSRVELVGSWWCE
jgi:hypothetical protein